MYNCRIDRGITEVIGYKRVGKSGCYIVEGLVFRGNTNYRIRVGEIILGKSIEILIEKTYKKELEGDGEIYTNIHKYRGSHEREIRTNKVIKEVILDGINSDIYSEYQYKEITSIMKTYGRGLDVYSRTYKPLLKLWNNIDLFLSRIEVLAVLETLLSIDTNDIRLEKKIITVNGHNDGEFCINLLSIFLSSINCHIHTDPNYLNN